MSGIFINIKDDLIRLESILRVTHEIKNDVIEMNVILRETNDYGDYNILKYSFSSKVEYKDVISKISGV